MLYMDDERLIRAALVQKKFSNLIVLEAFPLHGLSALQLYSFHTMKLTNEFKLLNIHPAQYCGN